MTPYWPRSDTLRIPELSAKRMVSQTCARKQRKSFEPRHKGSIHTVQSSKESKKDGYWSFFQLPFSCISIIYVDTCSVEISSGPVAPHEDTTVSVIVGQGRVAQGTWQGLVQHTGKTEAHNIRLVDKLATESDSSWPGTNTFWGGFTLREPKTPTLRVSRGALESSTQVGLPSPVK